MLSGWESLHVCYCVYKERLVCVSIIFFECLHLAVTFTLFLCVWELSDLSLIYSLSVQEHSRTLGEVLKKPKINPQNTQQI